MTTQPIEQSQNHRFNGLDAQALVQTVEAVKRDASLATFQFRARNRWLGGMVNRSSIQDFYGVGAEDQSRKEPFTFTSSEPPVLLGANEGAGAGEFLLHALAACVTSTAVMLATARGIRIESISTELRGDVDLRGLLGLDPSVRPGFQRISIKMAIKAACSDVELDELMTLVSTHSPVYDTISRPVEVVLARV